MASRAYARPDSVIDFKNLCGSSKSSGNSSSSYSRVPRDDALGGGVPRLQRGAPIGTHDALKCNQHLSPDTPSNTTIATLRFVTICLVSLSYLCAGLLTCAWIGTRSADADLREDLACVPIVRESDYSTAELVIGTPPRSVRALVRMDVVSTTCVAGQLFDLHVSTNKVIHSQSVLCEESTCVDVTLAWNSGSAARQRTSRLVSFRYTPASTYLQVGVSLGLDAEMYLCPGATWRLGIASLCVGSTADAKECSGGVAANVVAAPSEEMDAVHLGLTPPGALFVGTTRGELLRNSEWASKVPAAEKECDATDVVYLFPAHAALYSFWVHLQPQHLASSGAGHGYVSDIFKVREMGGSCSNSFDELKQPLMALQAGCSNVATLQSNSFCASTAAVTFVRMSSRTVEVSAAETDICVRSEQSSALISINRHSFAKQSSYDQSSFDLSSMAGLRLVIMFVVAAIVWTQNGESIYDSEDTINDVVMLHCINSKLTSDLHHTKEAIEYFNKSWQKYALAFVAVAIRGIVVISSSEALWADGCGVVVITESVACLVSLAHFVALLLLNWISSPDYSNCFLHGFGEMCSVVDVSCASMIVFSRAPILASSSEFDSVARLLLAMLFTIVCTPSVIFNSACAMSLAETYQVLLAIATWTFQAISLAVSLSMLFCWPSVAMMFHASAGSTWLAVTTLFVSVSTIGSAPRITGRSKLLVLKIKQTIST